MSTDLSRVWFQNGVNAMAADAMCERRWVALVSGEAGEATIRLPRNSDAASSLFIDPEGGSVVRILSNGGCGEWQGVVVDVDDSDANLLIITAYQSGKLLGRRIVNRPGTLVNVSAGYSATVVLTESLSGIRGLSIVNDPFEGGVLSEREFDPNGDAWGGLTALMDASDGEVHITAGGDVNWCGPLAYAGRYDPLLVEGGNLQDVAYTSSIQNRVSEVTAGEGPQQFTARSGDAARDGWPAQGTVDGTAATAQRELEARSQASITISGGVTSEHWSIRERDFVQVLVPRAGFGGRMHRCRVLSRSLTDGDHLMRLELQVIQPVAPTTITGSGAGARQRPPQRASDDLSSGSFAQLFALIRRKLSPHATVRNALDG